MPELKSRTFLPVRGVEPRTSRVQMALKPWTGYDIHFVHGWSLVVMVENPRWTTQIHRCISLFPSFHSHLVKIIIGSTLRIQIADLMLFLH